SWVSWKMRPRGREKDHHVYHIGRPALMQVNASAGDRTPGIPMRGRMVHGRWWAHQDSNLEPRDSRVPEVSSRRGLSLHPPPGRVGCGTLEPVIKGTAAPR